MKRRTKVAIAFGVIAAGALLITFNTTAQTGPQALGVSAAKRDASLLSGRELAVRGVVENVTTNGTLVESFVLSEGGEKLLVHYAQPPPDNFGPSKDVVVYGRLESHMGGFGTRLVATSIQVGCSSKY